MRCFYHEDLSQDGNFIALEKSEHQHLFKTLRAKHGDTIKLIDGKGMVAIAQVSEGHRICVMEKTLVPPLSPHIHLVVSPPRRNQMEQLLRQSAELGVRSIMPVVTDYSVALPHKESTQKRWLNILIEGCKQSGNPYFPELCSPAPFAVVVRRLQQAKFQVFYGACRAEDGKSLTVGPAQKNIAWIVGPEGGFSEEEIRLMETENFKGLKINPWILRVETAAVCGLCLLRNLQTDQ